MSTKKSTTKKPKPKEPKPTPTPPEEPQPEESPASEQPPAEQPTPEAVSTPTPTPTPTPVITLETLHQDLESLKLVVAELQETLARKRKPVTTNSKVQILDKQTGEIYPSKNNAYQTLLKSGALKSLVDKGIFGDIPKKNTFGWYVLVRELPERFEEVKPAEDVQQ